MALDIYIMPLWKFKVGDFQSPVEAATGLRPKVITSEGIAERAPRVGWFGRWRARRQVAAVRHAVEKRNDVRIDWADDGGVVYSEQSGGMTALRAYTRWLDLREQLPEFSPPPDGNYYNHSALRHKGLDVSCPHLVEHDCHAGYFLPCDFKYLAEVEPFVVGGRWTYYRSVGSSPRLLEHLEIVQQHLRVPADYGYLDDDPLLGVKAGYLQLREVAELSCRHKLPIIFWG